jgi:hypothetical protein
MTKTELEESETPLEKTHALLATAIDAQPPGAEARYLARLVLLLMNELKYSESALKLIEVAHEK